MGKYSDFDLDLNQVKDIGNSGATVQSGLPCEFSIEFSKTVAFSCMPTRSDEPSCNCSASDMTLCGDNAKAGLLRC